MNLVDTHCHLNSLDHAPVGGIIAAAHDAGVTKMICIGASKGNTSTPEAVALAENYPSVYATVGIHPHDAGSFSDLSSLAEFSKHPRVVAVGETGLDFFKDWAPRDGQYQLFEASVALAKEIGKPIIIHCRAAEEETLEVLKRTNARDVGGVFHCFAQNAELAKQLAEINFLVSVPGILTFKNAHALREEIRKIPLEQIMLETDCPYMAPEPHRGKPSEPKHVLEIAKVLAGVKEVSLEKIAEQTSANANRLFGI